MPKTITKYDDIIDIETLIESFEALQDEHDERLENSLDEDDQNGPESIAYQSWLLSEDGIEYGNIKSFLEDMRGNGGDVRHKGDWYPSTAIRESYFTDYAQELAEDIGDLSRDVKWPYTCIDWEKAANELKMDYSTAEFDGITYYFR